MKKKKIKILFVCLGNICRSPSAEAVMKQLVKVASMDNQIYIDSAGLHGYHRGEMADSRMRAYAAKRGYKLESISRPIEVEDFYEFDMIVGMDDSNIEALKRLAPDPESMEKIHRMTEFSQLLNMDHVPDPYYSGADGFELVLDILEDSCGGLLKKIAE